MTTEMADNETVEALARYRYTAIRHAADFFNDDGTVQYDGLSPAKQTLPGLLVSSLEELKVAEEELRAQNAALLAQRAAVNEHVRHYRELFLQSPAPVLVTDLYGTIAEANLAAGRLFRRDVVFLARKPLAAMIPPSRRDDFRRRFARFSPADGAREWCFMINRLGDVPIEVCATVKLVGGIGPTSSGVLYWLFSGCV